MPTRRCAAGCYGEPIFNRLFGVALSYFIITLPAFPEPYTDGIFIDAPLLVCFIFQTVALLVTLAAGMLDKFRIRSWLGWVRGPTFHSPFRLCAGLEGQADRALSVCAANSHSPFHVCAGREGPADRALCTQQSVLPISHGRFHLVW